MSLTADGFWIAGFFAPTFFADGFWIEGVTDAVWTERGAAAGAWTATSGVSDIWTQKPAAGSWEV